MMSDFLFLILIFLFNPSNTIPCSFFPQRLRDPEEHPMVRHEAAEALGGMGREECLEVWLFSFLRFLPFQSISIRGNITASWSSTRKPGNNSSVVVFFLKEFVEIFFQKFSHIVCLQKNIVNYIIITPTLPKAVRWNVYVWPYHIYRSLGVTAVWSRQRTTGEWILYPQRVFNEKPITLLHKIAMFYRMFMPGINQGIQVVSKTKIRWKNANEYLSTPIKTEWCRNGQPHQTLHLFCLLHNLFLHYYPFWFQNPKHDIFWMYSNL